MHIGLGIRAWRQSKNISVESLSDVAVISPTLLEQIEAQEIDPTLATVQALANAIGIPPAWLFDSPQSFDHLFRDTDGPEEPGHSDVDPVTVRILTASRLDRTLFVLLTTLMQAGDPKLLRAAEVSLLSLVKQSRQTTVPWQQRPSGHFEPPSD